MSAGVDGANVQEEYPRGFLHRILTENLNGGSFSDELRSQGRQDKQIKRGLQGFDLQFAQAFNDYFRAKFNPEGALQEFLKNPVFPFFNPELKNTLKEMGQPESGSSSKNMSANIQTTDRSHIKECCNEFCVDFIELDMSRFLNTDFDVSADVETVIDCLNRLFTHTFDNYQAKNDKNGNYVGDFADRKVNKKHETSEIAYLTPPLDKLLNEVYGFGFEQKTGPLEDVEIIVIDESGNQTKIGGETKTALNLPIKQIDSSLSTNLCWFGFATVLCRQQKLDGKEQTLQTALGLIIKTGKSKVERGDIGSVANLLLDDTEAYESKFEEVKNALQGGIIRSNDAVGFWTAVMQACINAVNDKDRFAFVLSARQMWYINLLYDPQVADDYLRCKVAISDGYEVGSKSFLPTLVKFLHYIKDIDKKYSTMGNRVQDIFYRKLAKDVVERAQNHAGSTDDEEKYNGESGSEGESGGGSGDGIASNGGSSDRSNDEDNKKRKDKDGDGCRVAGKDKRQRTHSKFDHSTASNGLDEVRPLCPPLSGMRKATNDQCDASSRSKMNCNSNSSSQSTATANTVSPEPAKSTPFVPSYQQSRNKMTDEEQMWWQRALMHFPNEHEETSNNKSTSAKAMNTVSLPSLLGRDKYGPVPYLCQIKNVRRVIGNGRCGKVLEIDWCKQKVAMKLYQGDPDNEDEEDWYGIFERERERFLDLKTLWGTHVPALLFHNPWWTCPSLGMQLGQPVYHNVEKWDDIGQWDEADIILMKKTLSEVRKLGWIQEDLRGLNFVRLIKDGKEFIAMVDMESVIRVNKKEDKVNEKEDKVNEKYN